MEYLITALNVLLLLGPPKLAEAMGKGQVQSSPELGHELEFNRTSRRAAVAATAWIRSMTTMQSFACTLRDLLWHRHGAYHH